MLKRMITCPHCGYVAVDSERFANHQPCAGEVDTAWLSWGSGGKRLPNRESAVKEGVIEAMTNNPRVGSVSVHDGRCILGRTINGPCSCDPITFLRPSSQAALHTPGAERTRARMARGGSA